MSKIELTEEQATKLHAAWISGGIGRAGAYSSIINEAVNMGLVRPATDDLAARVAALEAKVNGNQWDKAPDTYDEEAARGIAAAHNTPDPHAAAKDRAKLWGVELVRVKQGEGGDLSFASKTQYWNRASWLHLETTPVEEMYGFYKTTPEAWSNFTTEPPPGWEAPTGVTVNLPLGQHTVTVPFDQPPRTEADRLGDVLFSQFCTGFNWNDAEGRTKLLYCNAALAVRKAVLAAQLEPSEEEVDAAVKEWYATGANPISEETRNILKAAARVRLEKAEGEQ